VNDSSTFSNNLNYSWNRNASLLFFESPPGVGFSINKDIDTGYVFSDQDTA
jgi:carboxypeptidase C (cathepsin A)